MARISGVFALCALASLGQPPAPRPRFDIADVHPSGPAMNPFTLVSGGVLRGDRYSLRKATMLDLIRIAWQVQPETIVGGPDWLEFDRFDIVAKAPATSSAETVRQMLQSLLIERFHLAVHKDVRPMPAYVLSTGKLKARLTASSGDNEPGCKYVNQPAASNAMAFSCRNITMAAFASRYLRSIASEYIKEPVIDATVLEGAWDFDLHWTRRSAPLTEGGERTTIFNALDKQLGLSLILREAPAPVLVIDHLDKPTPNPPDIAQKLPRREPVFDVATLRIDKTGRPGHVEYTRGGIDASSALLAPMLGFAWDISSVHTRERMVGLPNRLW